MVGGSKTISHSYEGCGCTPALSTLRSFDRLGRNFRTALISVICGNRLILRPISVRQLRENGCIKAEAFKVQTYFFAASAALVSSSPWPKSLSLPLGPRSLAVAASAFSTQSAERSGAVCNRLATAQRVGDGHGQSRLVQRALRRPMIFGRRLHDHPPHRKLAEQALQPPQSATVIGDAEALAGRMDIDIQPLFTHVDAGIDWRHRIRFGQYLACMRDLLPIICSGPM